jgi:hypothetical protein
MRRRLAVAAVLAALLAAGCAPAGTATGVASAGSPGARTEGALILAEGMPGMRTPCRLDLGSMPDEFELRIDLDGFQEGRVMMRRAGDRWTADITDLGRTPCLAIDTLNGDVYAADIADVQRMRPADAVTLGLGQTGYLGAVTVTDVGKTWVRVTHLWPEGGGH